jgi:hypothetical protein
MKDEVLHLWHSLYDQGLAQGTVSFNAPQKTLYHYIDLLYCVEMNGVTGFLYNNIGKEDRMLAFIHCLSYFGLEELSQPLDYIYAQVKGQPWQEAESWEDYLTRFPAIDKVDALENHLYQKIANYPIEDWIDQHYKDLSKGIAMRKP